ncbi:MAG: hypothetical protein ACRC6D_03085, partial [Aeromonas sp.]
INLATTLTMNIAINPSINRTINYAYAPAQVMVYVAAEQAYRSKKGGNMHCPLDEYLPVYSPTLQRFGPAKGMTN